MIAIETKANKKKKGNISYDYGIAFGVLSGLVVVFVTGVTGVTGVRLDFGLDRVTKLHVGETFGNLIDSSEVNTIGRGKRGRRRRCRRRRCRRRCSTNSGGFNSTSASSVDRGNTMLNTFVNLSHE